MRARRRSVRVAGEKYQGSVNGRRRHAERQRRYRARQRAARVTHQPYSSAEPASAIVDPSERVRARRGGSVMHRWWMAVTPGPLRTRVVVIKEAGKSVLLARLPHGPRHPQALQRLSEALALWCGQPVRVALAVEGPEAFCITRRWFATFEQLTRAPLYEIEFVEALPPPDDEARFGDVRQMLRARMARG